MKNCFITAMMNYLIQGLQTNLQLQHTDLDIALLPEIFRNYLPTYVITYSQCFSSWLFEMIKTPELS